MVSTSHQLLERLFLQGSPNIFLYEVTMEPLRAEHSLGHFQPPAPPLPIGAEADGALRPLGCCCVHSSTSKMRRHVPLVQTLPARVPPPPPVLVPPPLCKCHQHCQRRAHRLCCCCRCVTGTTIPSALEGVGGGRHGGQELSGTVGSIPSQSEADEGQTERQDIKEP